tara:strand:- start:752 stop:1033 length:282 start_codon:yes stop_codon:yes gene_type:complete
LELSKSFVVAFWFVFGSFYNTPKYKTKNMTDNSELDNLFEEDKGIASEENKTNVSDNLALTGTVIMGLGWLGLITSGITSAALESVTFISFSL